MNDYVNAKANITAFQQESDLVIFNQANQYSADIADRSKAAKIGYPSEETAHVKDGAFYYNEHIICSTDVMQIVGAHNLDNACAAIDAIWGFTNDTSVIERGLHSFTGLPHRLHYVRNIGDVTYYDDSIATTPSSAIAALRAFDQPKVIILGGSSKGSDFAELGRELTRYDVQAILIGDEAGKIASACDEAGFKDYQIPDDQTMTHVVNLAHSLARPGSVVLLSPASASFGLFKNYADRGEQFIAAVEALPVN
jgi:UDP-N-acetylmuramoylalanine--D-glutamate ligase